MLVVKGSHFIYGKEFLSIFQILMFLFQVPINEIRGPTGLELDHIQCFQQLWLE